MMSDASEMLAAALEQMDGIIAGTEIRDITAGTEGVFTLCPYMH